MKRTKEQWIGYRNRELSLAAPLIEALGFSLDTHQPHIEGERFLMSGEKLVLLGARIEDGRRAVIKVSSLDAGRNEIQRERERRRAIQHLPFAYEIFEAPEELLYRNRGGWTILATAFIEQEKPFLARPQEEQALFALRGLKMQEGAHATTSGHFRRIRRILPNWTHREYRRDLSSMTETIVSILPERTDLKTLLLETARDWEACEETVDRYCGFLTHADFVPHNLRIAGDTLYLLDYASLRFGNKHESWARFVNFMMLYNPALEHALVSYIAENRYPGESESLRLMRAYKAVFLIEFYAKNLALTDGALHALTEARIRFWSYALKAIMTGEALPRETIDEYCATRDSLRSPEEQERQRDLH